MSPGEGDGRGHWCAEPLITSGVCGERRQHDVRSVFSGRKAERIAYGIKVYFNATDVGGAHRDHAKEAVSPSAE